jgi:hypothetical protein
MKTERGTGTYLGLLTLDHLLSISVRLPLCLIAARHFWLSSSHSQARAMANNQETQSKSGENTDSRDQEDSAQKITTSTFKHQSSSSSSTRTRQESKAATLPSYSQQADRPPTYSDAGIYSFRPNPSNNLESESRPQAKPPTQPFNAAAVNAIMATSSSSTDKMHSKPGSSRKVDDWNEDPTYKSRLASLVGSTRKWNYFGADIGGNPFRRSGKKK